MGRALRRALARIKPQTARVRQRTGDSALLRTMPYRVSEVFAPIESVLSRIEIEGTVDSVQGQPIFREPGSGGWYALAPAIHGLVDFHAMASSRKGIAVCTDQMLKLARKLEYGSPISEDDLRRARGEIDALKRFDLNYLTLGDAKEYLTDTQIAWAIKKSTKEARP